MTPSEPIVPGGNRMSMTRIQTLGLMAAMVGGYSFCDTNTRRSEPPVKPCLACGKPKQHNNEFCSAECCRAWKKK